MGTGMSPTQAAAVAIKTIARKYPNFVGAIVAANKNGGFGNYWVTSKGKWGRYLSYRVNLFHIPTNQIT